MSLKNLREKIEQHEQLRDDACPIVFKKGDKYYTNPSYSVEVSKSDVRTKGLTVIHFAKSVTV